MFFYIKCVLFVLVLSISGEISAQEKRDSVRIYFHQGKVNIDTCLLDNGNEMERFAKICSALNDSVRLIRKIQIIGGASPEGGGLLNGRLSEKRAEVLWRYISPYSSFRNTKVSENSDMAKSWATFCCSGTYK